MNVTVHIAPPNALVLLVDGAGGCLPSTMAGRLVAFTESCIAIGTQEPTDGETTVVLSKSPPNDCSSLLQVFDGVLKSPSHTIALLSVNGDTYCNECVGRDVLRVKIWANHNREPDAVHIMVN